ncbi:hypothetical protein ISN45_Aa08g007140 [Arabidopsis thaliana x Arabidopsis arenosa]|uniref:Transmembrane protein n=1 Tax=Arabidopsis thaliana x Arabidopsis arenosa TaxID=1240361 RepID=A0A8T1XFN4_9BRAS|nr:hypothetical protein ISN45_Aa08g007140 [Arabidopsis thaliana x Arabidopsis arenosa]
MKKITQALLLLTLLHILICLSFQVRVTEARFRHLGEERIGTIPSRPCGAPPRASQVTLTGSKRSCKKVRRRQPPLV